MEVKCKKAIGKVLFNMKKIQKEGFDTLKRNTAALKKNIDHEAFMSKQRQNEQSVETSIYDSKCKNVMTRLLGNVRKLKIDVFGVLRRNVAYGKNQSKLVKRVFNRICNSSLGQLSQALNHLQLLTRERVVTISPWTQKYTAFSIILVNKLKYLTKTAYFTLV